MKYKVEQVTNHFENILLKLEGVNEWVYVHKSFFEGLEIDGIIVEKISRLWLEKDISLAEAIEKKDHWKIKQIEKNMKKGQVVRVI